MYIQEYAINEERVMFHQNFKVAGEPENFHKITIKVAQRPVYK